MISYHRFLKYLLCWVLFGELEMFVSALTRSSQTYFSTKLRANSAFAFISKQDQKRIQFSTKLFMGDNESKEANTTKEMKLETWENVVLQSIDGLRLCGKRWGKEGGKPLLALHGWLDNASSFNVLAPSLAQEGFHVFALDFPGHGLSSHRSLDSMYTVTDYPFYALEVARCLGWKKFSIVGHSMGAVVASMVAASMPEMIDQCVLIEGLGPLSYDAKDSAAHLQKNLKSRGIFLKKYQQNRAKSYENIEAAVDARLNTIESLPGNQYLSREAARTMVLRALRPAGHATSTVAQKEYSFEELKDKKVSFVHDMRLNMVSPSYYTEDQALSFVKSIQCRTLLVMATQGWPYPTEKYENRRKLIASALRNTVCSNVLIEGGHHLHLDPDTCDEVTSIVTHFLGGTTIRSAL